MLTPGARFATVSAVGRAGCRFETELMNAYLFSPARRLAARSSAIDSGLSI
jgi:hypothetical protein